MYQEDDFLIFLKMSVLFVLFVFYMLICKMDVVPKALIPPLKEHRQCAGAFFIPKKEKTDGIQEYTEL